jgi:leucyl aminopeptidase
MAERAERIARAAGLEAKVLDDGALRRAGLGALLGVARGSAEPPRVVHLIYRPRGHRPSAKIALVGKGVTFDSGGLNLKSGSGMAAMKGDMAGAAAVLAAMSVLPAVGCRAEVHGVLGLVENMTGGAAYKPGDVLSTLSGKTVEVANTDAEGRLVLADLFTWVERAARPGTLVDVATLTGAIVVALGPTAAGLFSPDDDLAEAISTAATAVGERVWRMPLYEDHRDDLDSEVADLRNVGDRQGGSITAALFLREFVPDGVTWAHLDVAGPAFLEKPRAGLASGGTGAGIATLVRWLEGV